jgi:hypothetical protein
MPAFQNCPNRKSEGTQNMSDTTREGSTASGSDRSWKDISQTSEVKQAQFAHTFATFQHNCEDIVQSLSLKYPTGIQLDGVYGIIDQRHHGHVTVTLKGKRSTHGGIRDPTTPTTAHIEVPKPNPSISVLLEYVRKNMGAQLEAGCTVDYMRTKKFQVDTHLTVIFEFRKDE